MPSTAPAHRPNHPARKPSRVNLPEHFRSMVRRVDSTSYQIVGLPIDSDDPLFRDREHAERWLSDRLPQLAKVMKRGPRPCLCCAETFISEGPHNRMCDHCRRHDGNTHWRESA